MLEDVDTMSAEPENQKMQPQKSQALMLLDRIDELGLIKQVIAKDSPFIINLEVRQDCSIPTLPQGKMRLISNYYKML